MEENEEMNNVFKQVLGGGIDLHCYMYKWRSSSETIDTI